MKSMTRKIEMPQGQLKKLYVEKGHSIREIGKILDCNHTTILTKPKAYYHTQERHGIFKIAQIFGGTPTIIFRRLNKYESPKGTNGQNGDFWRASINDRYAILRFFRYIKPGLQHRKRLRDLISAEYNVIKRISGNQGFNNA